MTEQQNGHDNTDLQVGTKEPDNPVVPLSIPGIEILLRSLSEQDRGIFESDLRTVVNNWLRATGLIKV